MAATVKTFGISPYFIINLGKSPYPIRCLASRNSITVVNGITFAAVKEESNRVSLDLWNNEMIPNVEENIKREKGLQEEKLEALWDDGYGSQTGTNGLDFAKELIKPDGGPPRWFTPLLCEPPLRNSPTLLFLPGVDGVGLGLIPHHKALGKVFNVQCLYIPVKDQTPFKELVEYIEQTVRAEHFSAPNKPIYIVGDSLGGCLALAVAARNPQIDLVLFSANPATSFNRSQLQPLLPLLEVLPDDPHITVSGLLGFIIGNPMKTATVNLKTVLPPLQSLGQLVVNLTTLLPYLSDLADMAPKQTLLWKLNFLKRAAAYANSRLHSVKAEVIVLASEKDNILPSGDEALRLLNSLQNCRIRCFKDNGHAILMEDGINLLTIIKGTCTYRRSRNRDFVTDFLPPSMSEFKQMNEGYRWYHDYTSPVMLSTKEDGTIVRGLAGVPSEGSVLFVGYHMLMGLEIVPLIAEFLREKRIMVRVIAHPIFFSRIFGDENKESSVSDYVSLYGALTVSPSNLFKLLSAKSHVLLFPGGAREALHRKGEEYKLFWPDQPEFVRMAARFGATIVPFGVVGEDDIAELVLDYDDLMKLPIISDQIRRYHVQYAEFNVRAGMSGEVANQPLYLPTILPKIPAGRLYYLFGKPIQTKGRKEILKDKQKAMGLYLQIKSEVEKNLSYLLKKRNEDPYRCIIDRAIHTALEAPSGQIPTFKL